MPRKPTAAMPKQGKAKSTADEPATDNDQPTLQEAQDDANWFVSLDDSTENTNTLLYGREGSGKTTALARLANLSRPGKVLVMNAEGGLKKQALIKRGVDVSRVAVWPDPAKGQVLTFKGLDQVYRRLKADLMADPGSWVGVGMDSATEVHQALLNEAQGKRVLAVQNKGADVDEHFVDISDYGTMSKMFRDLLRKFRDLPCHFVVTALERRDVDKDTGKPQYGPAVTPGLQSDLMGYVDWVLMMKAADEDGPFRALTRANSRYRAKDRYDVLPKVIAEPMMDRLIGYLAGEITEDEDPFQQDLPKKAIKAQDKPDTVEPDEDDPADDADDPAA